LDFSKSEEIFAENLVKQIKEKGVNLVVAGGSIADICMHYFNKYEIGVLRIPSKFELL
jgi:T-complex protein 1 subunit theta